MMKTKSLKQVLHEKNKVLGTWSTLSSPYVSDIVASTGLDFVIIDFEHGPFSTSALINLVNAIRVNNSIPIVRVPQNIDWMSLQALDSGAAGLICPHVKNLEESLRFTRPTKYEPVGTRGFSPYTKSGGYGSEGALSYTKAANDSGFNMIIIECLEGLHNVDSISDDPNLDAIYFGSFDISMALGVPGEVHHPKVEEAILKAAEVAKGKGKFVGGFVAMSDEDLEWQKNSLFDIVIYEVDNNILQKKYSKAVSYFNRQGNL